MSGFGSFENTLRQVLAHLYDPTYPVPPEVAQVLGCGPNEIVDAIQSVLIRAVRDLEPAPDVPGHARAWRLYRVLSLRYLQQLTQEDAASRLMITPRHLAREQARAIQLLARHLWREHGGIGDFGEFTLDDDTLSDAPVQGEIGIPGTRHLQIEKELASLKAHAPGAVTDIGKAFRGIAGLVGGLIAQHNLSLDLGPVKSGILADIHPSVFRQVLVGIISYTVGAMTSGRLHLRAKSAQESIEVQVVGRPAVAVPPPADWFPRELLQSQAGRLACCQDGDSLCFSISLPASRNRTVLVIDDNEELVHFYRLCTAGTIYHIVNVTKGRRVFETVEAVTPSVIVLDLMLPDMDGWELLSQLHENSLSKSIPIVLCSVVREEELAYALGANVCLTKPVRRRQFIQALDQALGRGLAAAPREHASNEVIC